MHESSKSRFARKRSPRQHASTRFLIEDPATGWRIFSLGKASLVYGGKLSLPRYGGRIIRVVYAHAGFDGRKILDLYKLEPSDWKFDSEGRVDQEENMRRIRKKLNPRPGHVSGADAIEPQLTEADISAIRRCLRLQGNG